jgi:hypothetical protein
MHFCADAVRAANGAGMVNLDQRMGKIRIELPLMISIRMDDPAMPAQILRTQQRRIVAAPEA